MPKLYIEHEVDAHLTRVVCIPQHSPKERSILVDQYSLGIY